MIQTDKLYSVVEFWCKLYEISNPSSSLSSFSTFSINNNNNDNNQQQQVCNDINSFLNNVFL